MCEEHEKHLMYQHAALATDLSCFFQVYFRILLTFSRNERGFKNCHFAFDSPNAL